MNGFSSYTLKPHFQNLLLPLRDWCIQKKITPNFVTLSSCVMCLLFAYLLLLPSTSGIFLYLVPPVMLLKIVINALDGMIAVQARQRSAFGAVLNELCDFLSDIVLFGVFALLLSDRFYLWWLLVVMVMLVVVSGLAVVQANIERPHSGPFSKSDRAIYLSLLAVLMILIPAPHMLYQVYAAIGSLLAAVTIIARLKKVSRSYS